MPVARFRFPDGRIGRFNVPDGTTPEQAQAMMQDFASKQAPTDNGFFGNIKQDYANRMKESAQIQADYEAGKIGKIGRGIDLAGKVGAGFLGDVATEGAKKVAEGLSTAYPVATEAIKAVTAPAAEAIAPAANEAVHKWDSYRKEHPEHARRIESIVNIALFGAPVAKPVEAAGAAAVKGTEAAAKGLMEAPGAIARTAELAKKGLGADDLESLRGYISDVDKAAGENFRKVDSMNVDLGRDVAQSVVNDIGKIIKEPKEGVTRKLNPEFLSNLETLQGDVTQGYTGLGTLHRARQLFGESAIRAKKAGFKDDARVATEAINKIDDALEEVAKGARGEGFTSVNAPEAINALNEGIDQWARMRSVEKIANVIDEAGGEGKKVIAGINKILKDKKLSLGFTEEEKSYLKQASKEGTLGKILPQMISIGVGNKFGVAASKFPRYGLSPVRAGNIQKAVEGIKNRPAAEKFNPPQKLLPAPKKAAPQNEFLAYANGVIRRQTDKELQDAIAARGRYASMGMTPDIQKQVFVNEMRSKFKDIWPTIDKDTRSQIEEQIERAWRENQTNIRQVIGASQPESPTAMSEALMKARQR